MRTREEHLEWAKQRALEYVDKGQLANAIASMGSDVDKHPETKLPDITMGYLVMAAMLDVVNGDAPAVRRWVEGFR